MIFTVNKDCDHVVYMCFHAHLFVNLFVSVLYFPPCNKQCVTSCVQSKKNNNRSMSVRCQTMNENVLFILHPPSHCCAPLMLLFSAFLLRISQDLRH